MGEHDERLVYGVPAWAWTVLEEEPPYPPGYKARTRAASDEERERFVAAYQRKNLEEPPLNPDGLRFEVLETEDPIFLEAAHPDLPCPRLYGRVEKWEVDAREVPPIRRAAFWTSRADAVRLFCEAGHISDERMGTDEDLEADLRRRARAAEVHAEEVGPPVAATDTVVPPDHTPKPVVAVVPEKAAAVHGAPQAGSAPEVGEASEEKPAPDVELIQALLNPTKRLAFLSDDLFDLHYTTGGWVAVAAAFREAWKAAGLKERAMPYKRGDSDEINRKVSRYRDRQEGNTA